MLQLPFLSLIPLFLVVSVVPRLLSLHNLASLVLLEAAEEGSSLQNCLIVWFPTSLTTRSLGGGGGGGGGGTVPVAVGNGEMLITGKCLWSV